MTFGCVGVVVDAKDESAERFYGAYGFVTIDDSSCSDGTRAEFYITEQSKNVGIKCRFVQILGSGMTAATTSLRLRAALPAGWPPARLRVTLTFLRTYYEVP